MTGIEATSLAASIPGSEAQLIITASMPSDSAIDTCLSIPGRASASSYSLSIDTGPS